METACLVPQDRTSKDRKSMDKVFILRSRCLLCTRESNMSAMQLRLKKELDGVLLCSQTANCTRPRLPGRLQCQQCADAWNATALEREMSKRVKRNIKFGLGRLVADPSSMEAYLRQLVGVSLGPGWTLLRRRIRENPSDVFIVDTETGLMGLEDVHQIGIANYHGQTVLNEVLDHGCTVAEYFDRTLRSAQHRPLVAYHAAQKTYGPPDSRPMPGISALEIFKKLKAAGLTKS